MIASEIIDLEVKVYFCGFFMTSEKSGSGNGLVALELLLGFVIYFRE